MEYHSESESPTYYTPQSKFYALKTLGHMSSDEKWFKKMINNLFVEKPN